MKQKSFLHQKFIVPLLAVVVGLGILSGPISSHLATAAPIAASPSSFTARQSAMLTKNDTLVAIENTLEDIYTQVNPSVVSIQVTQKQEISSGPNFPDFPGFRFFFGQPQTPQNEQPQTPQEFYSHGAGSGFVWDKQGHIITNNHVIEGADKIMVTFADETTVAAEVVGSDPDSDLAVLKVDLPASQLQPVDLGDSTQVKVGQLAVAIGNPFGLENTMTVGFVSALGRFLPVSSGQGQGSLTQGPRYTIPDVIQTDAPINPGNSGGILVNDEGQVIGVTAAIESPVRASAGIGFAIPSAVVDRVVPALISEGHFDHPWLGLSGISLNPELISAMDLEANQRGALVIGVTPDSPADQAGLHGSDRQVTIEGQPVRVGGDVIIAIDDQPVDSFDDLVAYLAQATKVGQTVKLTVLRQGNQETISVKLTARPKPASPSKPLEAVVDNGVRLGVEGVTVTPDIAQAMGLPDDQTGVLVERIEIGSPADTADLNGSYKSATMVDGRLLPIGGDIITAVDGKTVNSVEDLQTAIQQAKPGQKVTLTVLRDNTTIEVSVTLGEANKPNE